MTGVMPKFDQPAWEPTTLCRFDLVFLLLFQLLELNNITLKDICMASVKAKVFLYLALNFFPKTS